MARTRQPSPVHQLVENGLQRIGLMGLVAWGTELGDHLVSIAHQNDLAGTRQPHILGESGLELLDADCFH
jgi:hypothetical protein